LARPSVTTCLATGPNRTIFALWKDADPTFATPNGRLVFGIFASIAEFERELIRDRVRSGIASARAKGRRIGRPAADPALTTKVRVLVTSGQSLRQVGIALRLSVATVHKYSALAANQV